MFSGSRAAGVTGERGFALVEVAVALGISCVLFSFAVLPLRQTIQGYRLAADARAVSSQLALAKMSAVADFTQAQLAVDLTRQTLQIKVYDKTNGQFATTRGVFSLSEGDSFSFGSVAVPAGQQATLQQTPTITFNSRGIPIDSTGTPTSDCSLNLTDNNGSYWAATISAAGQIGVWQYSNGGWIAR
ncbi:MAG TPA: prepilin-type N-terminal cleavage/methylation domain-containing protein [Candidatus Dormibacteraeota bacterium]|nr:prepilin-type N-terminal cleavage/methylation domain-containing protein [Candidatus Dormibacteraeota bacterium]